MSAFTPAEQEEADIDLAAALANVRKWQRRAQFREHQVPSAFLAAAEDAIVEGRDALCPAVRANEALVRKLPK